MFKLGLILAAASLAVASEAGCNDPKEPARAPDAVAPTTQVASAGSPRVFDQTTTSISAAPGEQVVVVLPGNASTPYAWKAAPPPDAAVVTVSDPKYTDAPPPGCAGCVGYKGTYAFTLTAKAAGKTKATFAYGSIVQKSAPPDKTVAIDVTVQ
jgi:predicted secreted protein